MGIICEREKKSRVSGKGEGAFQKGEFWGRHAKQEA